MSAPKDGNRSGIFNAMTNDPQAGYVAEQRELLSDKLIDDFIAGTAADKSSARVGVIWALRQMADKITSGELMVSKTVKRSDVKWNTPHMDMEVMPCCGRSYDVGDALKPGEFCRCGARIIE